MSITEANYRVACDVKCRQSTNCVRATKRSTVGQADSLRRMCSGQWRCHKVSVHQSYHVTKHNERFLPMSGANKYYIDRDLTIMRLLSMGITNPNNLMLGMLGFLRVPAHTVRSDCTRILQAQRTKHTQCYQAHQLSMWLVPHWKRPAKSMRMPLCVGRLEVSTRNITHTHTHMFAVIVVCMYMPILRMSSHLSVEWRRVVEFPTHISAKRC